MSRALSTVNALSHTVLAASGVFGAVMTNANVTWAFVSSTACWITQGVAPVAVAGNPGNLYVPANTIVLLASLGGDVAVIRDAADGKATLTPTTIV